ncbi:MAG: bifunctional homocysteine S-methyltransferase/methylenetetrahydrofolate reductase [Fimbriimonadales bacterium]|nr:bifunctional homocysteine S-methyltransferase/methylenetetrahydrofolate reductase [Fimbriimonadales bacterium]
MPLLDALAEGRLVGDGANGTWLSHLGFREQPCDLANLRAPSLVSETHRAYVAAGADVLETNTFGCNPFRLVDHAEDYRELCYAGAKLAVEAAEGRFVLGSIGPAGKPIEPLGSIRKEEFAACVRAQAQALAEGGVHGILLETFLDLEELAVAVRAVREACDLPILAMKGFLEDGETLSEGLPVRAAQAMESLGVAAVGANCIVGPQRMLDLVRMLSEGTSLPVLAYPTPGLPQLVRGVVSYDATPEYFARAAYRLFEEGAHLVGGCCGTTPAHIGALRELLQSKPLRAHRHGSVEVRARQKADLPTAQPSELSEKLGRKFVIAVELDLPRGLNLNRLLEGARRLKIVGTDVVNISDGARARLRMTPSAACATIQSRVGIEAMMHFSCRDRNLLAIQADILGAHALGIRNVLAITGDPANIGDYPSATSVFDVDSIGMVRILSRFNEGIDLAGNSVGLRCAFTIAVAFNPLAMDWELELDRLRRKAEAGAHLVYTQPVFEQRAIDRALEACASVGLPCLVGVLPLRSHRQAEFLHHEVPGIEIPERLRRRLAEADGDEEAQRIGQDEAAALVRVIRRTAQGLYLMPPFGNAGAAVPLVEEARVGG